MIHKGIGRMTLVSLFWLVSYTPHRPREAVWMKWGFSSNQLCLFCYLRIPLYSIDSHLCTWLPVLEKILFGDGWPFQGSGTNDSASNRTSERPQRVTLYPPLFLRERLWAIESGSYTHFVIGNVHWGWQRVETRKGGDQCGGCRKRRRRKIGWEDKTGQKTGLPPTYLHFPWSVFGGSLRLAQWRK